MPHCIIEYSKDLEDKIDPSIVIGKVYQGTLKSNLFVDEDIKTRAIAFEHYQTGSMKIDFIHIVVKILEGRDIKQKQLLSNSILEQFKNIDLNSISITIEICEIETVSYSKLVL